MKTIYFIVLLFSSIIYCALCEESENTPIVLWHGMGDSCCFPFSLGGFKDKLNETLGTYIYSIEIGSNVIEDVENGFFKHPSEQIEEVCKTLSADPKLANGFNAIGFSQGGQFLRGLIQRCPTIKVKSLISLGGQHQGVYGLPRCGALSISLCDYLRKLLNHAAYIDVVQKTLVQATYWHDPLDEATYKKESTFLADINNERTINADYIARLQQLEHLVLVKFDNDTMVQPVESEWFGFYKPGQSVEVESLEDSTFFEEDRLGLKKLVQESRIHFLSVEGDHLRFPWSWFEEYIIEIFLKNSF
ncbi:unnamed protein product [Psylliodes chrysocephalus]|uniref:Palmitoyl-protein thioesterase 1 n=1 Tax=Psylliodes chrysocephalus TaxID=3402493 RepID=A0A9P0CUP5_9CUCU|nr:unnamed protein product [Psylliodes chrysocephala]